MSESMDVEDERFCAKITVLKKLRGAPHRRGRGRDVQARSKLGQKRLEELGAQLEAMIAEEKPEEAAEMDEQQEEARV